MCHILNMSSIIPHRIIKKNTLTKIIRAEYDQKTFNISTSGLKGICDIAINLKYSEKSVLTALNTVHTVRKQDRNTDIEWRLPEL